jgi:lysophospholipase L1-like esterase
MITRTCLFITAALFLAFQVMGQDSPALNEKWEKEISGLEKRQSENPAPVGGIAFVGSSTMRLWKLPECFPDLKLANLGFGGSTIPDQLNFFDRLLTKMKPKQVIFYCGGNDLTGKSTPEKVAEDFQKWVGKMHALVPDCQITYLSIRPSSSREKIRDKETAANALVKAYCDKEGGKLLKFVDLSDTVVAAEGKIRDELFLKDKLHLNDAGYKIWSERVRPLLNLTLPH